MSRVRLSAGSDRFRTRNKAKLNALQDCVLLLHGFLIAFEAKEALAPQFCETPNTPKRHHRENHTQRIEN